MKEDFNELIEKYEKNKNLIKDNSYKTIEKFLNLFKNPSFAKLKSDNDLDFLFEDKIIFKFNEENILENIEKEYLILIYISQKENVKDSFYEKLLLELLNKFNPLEIFLNLKFFKKCLKFILKNKKDSIDTIKKALDNNNEIENINKRNIILFLYYYYYISNAQNINDLQNVNFEYIKVIFDLNKILYLYLTKESDYISCHNYFNYLFNKHFFKIKDISKNNLFPKLLNAFLEYLNSYSDNNNNIYENFLYIISFLICPTSEDDNNLIKVSINSVNSENNKIIEKIKNDILISNNSILHQISINLLNKNEKKLNEDFMKKYVSIYDVLDGFNCHLFKSLESEFKSILLFINDNNKKLDNINEYMNLFILLNRKVFNHDNSRIHKFFIKTICHMENLDNEIFSEYFFNDFLENINSSMLYPENEKHIYHNKVGILINSFLTKYLNKNKKYFFEFIHGLSTLVNNRKVIPYLINTIDNVLLNMKDLKDLEGNKMGKIINDILAITEKLCNGNSSQYQKFKNYDTVGKLLILILSNENYLNKENNRNETIIDLIKIYHLLFEYTLNFNKEIASIEYLNLSDIQTFDKDSILYKAIIAIIELLKKNLSIDNDFDYDQFVNHKNNSFIKNLSPKILNLLFFSLNYHNNDNLNSFLISNGNKLFSDYLNEEQKKEYILKFNTILLVQKFFNLNKKQNLNEVKDVFDNIFSTLKTYANSKNDVNISRELFEQYELVLFHYITAYNFGFNDILINNIQTTLNSSTNFIFRLLFIKMYLFQYLTCMHYDIFELKNKALILENKNLKNNLVSILNYLIDNESSINDTNKILFLKCFILSIMSLNTINYNENNEILLIFEKIENNGYSKLNLEFFYNYFDILSFNDLFYSIKFFNIYFNVINIKEENEEKYLNEYELFIDKCTKAILEKRENFFYLNIMTFICTLLNNKLIAKDKFVPVVKSAINKFIDLNENRIWLLLKLSVEVLLNNIKKDLSLLNKYQDIIIELATIKETRGEDSFMLQTSPYYIKSPFNLKIKKILPYNETIAKYGLHIRYYVLYFMENLIKDILSKNDDDDGKAKSTIFDVVFDMISNIVTRINNMSGSRPEMVFTEKHREKLRLSQLLVTLGCAFNLIRKENSEYINNFINKNKKHIDDITNVIKDIFSKTNLQSVDFYVYNFNLQFLFFSSNLRKFYLDSMNNPKTKSYLVSACIIIISIAILENVINDKNEIIKFIDAITILCTSNVCNIRGFAQYFIDKIFTSDELLKNDCISKNNINQSFVHYLKRNQNIQKFFSKFEDKYQEYIRLLKDFSTENMLKGNLDEIYCEIVPIDLNQGFKIISEDCLVIDNVEYGKISSSWRFVFDTQKEIENILKNEDKNNDFQKKYRPLDNNIYHDMNHKRKRHDIIVVGSLIDKAPNLGGLTRTCEIFNIGALTIPNESFLKDIGFQRAAASGEKWTPLLSVPPCTVKEFIISYKKMGYTVIGLEQTQNSIDIRNYKFHEKTLIVLGNEKEGIPQDVINLIDNCIIIPQYGNIRSLNVHVSAAIMLWECIQSLNNP